MIVLWSYVAGFIVTAVVLVVVWMICTPETLEKSKVFSFLSENKHKSFDDGWYDDSLSPLGCIGWISAFWFVVIPIALLVMIGCCIVEALYALRDIIQKNKTEEKIRNYYKKK